MALITSGPERQLYSHRRICLHVSFFNIPFSITFLNYTFTALYSLYLVFGLDLISGYLTLIPHFPSFFLILLLSSLFLLLFAWFAALYIYHHALSVPEITPAFICLCVAVTFPRYYFFSPSPLFLFLTSRVDFSYFLSRSVYVYILYNFHPAPCCPPMQQYNSKATHLTVAF